MRMPAAILGKHAETSTFGQVPPAGSDRQAAGAAMDKLLSRPASELLTPQNEPKGWAPAVRVGREEEAARGGGGARFGDGPVPHLRVSEARQVAKGVLDLSDPMTAEMLEAFERGSNGGQEATAVLDAASVGGLPPLPPGFSLVG